MSTTDTRAAFEYWFSDEGAHPRAIERSSNGGYILAAASHAWNVWQAATEAAKATSVAAGELAPLPDPLEINWPELNSNALGCGVEDRGIRDRYEAAEYGWQDGVDKAIERVPEAIYDANQMREYGQKCAEAARQLIPEVELPEGWKIVPLKMTDEQAKETAYNINCKYKVAGTLSDFLVRQIWEWGIYASPNPPAEAARQPAPVASQDAETWLRERYGAARGHHAWRDLEEAFKAGQSAALAATAAPVLSDEQIMEIAAPHLRIDITDMSDEWLQDCRTKFIATVRAILAATRSQP